MALAPQVELASFISKLFRFFSLPAVFVQVLTHPDTDTHTDTQTHTDRDRHRQTHSQVHKENNTEVVGTCPLFHYEVRFYLSSNKTDVDC